MKTSNRSLLSRTISTLLPTTLVSVAIMGVSTASQAESAVASIDTFDVGWDIKIEGNPGGGGGEGGTPGGGTLGGIVVQDAVHYEYHASFTPDPVFPASGQVDWDITHYYPTSGPFYTWETYFSGSAWSYSEENWTTAPMTSGTYVVAMTPPQPSPRAWRKYIFTLDVGY